MNKEVLLIAFYNARAMGARYLARALEKKGYTVHILFFMEFDSAKPQKPTEQEIELAGDLIRSINPAFIGFSVMSSLYWESVMMLNTFVRRNFSIPVVWGGVYPTLFPEKSLDNADYVIRGEGEDAILELFDALDRQEDPGAISNLAMRNTAGELVINEVRPLEQELDRFGYPEIGHERIYTISHNSIKKGDPQISGFTYEMTASRGCPFNCSYCNSTNLKRLYKGKGRFVRMRSVESVMEELLEAKHKIHRLKVIHFWDEIFSSDGKWVKAFVERYKKEIGVPFRIWGHPNMIREDAIQTLVDAGLYQVVIGIQSGSPSVRKEIFHRDESQEAIIQCSRTLAKCGVPKVIYDLILQHPFENLEQLKESYRLCMQLQPPFELQIHSLNFFPGTDIVQIAIDKGIYSIEELENLMYSSLEEQYGSYWVPGKGANKTWLAMVYLTQFPVLHSRLRRYEKALEEGQEQSGVVKLEKMARKYLRFKNVAQKGLLVINPFKSAMD